MKKKYSLESLQEIAEEIDRSDSIYMPESEWLRLIDDADYQYREVMQGIRQCL